MRKIYYINKICCFLTTNLEFSTLSLTHSTGLLDLQLAHHSDNFVTGLFSLYSGDRNTCFWVNTLNINKSHL